MTTTERHDLLNAVLASRDDIDGCDLDNELLEAIVDAEAEHAGDGQAAMRIIDAAVTAAMDRGVGREEKASDEPAQDGASEGEA